MTHTAELTTSTVSVFVFRSHTFSDDNSYQHLYTQARLISLIPTMMLHISFLPIPSGVLVYLTASMCHDSCSETLDHVTA